MTPRWAVFDGACFYDSVCRSPDVPFRSAQAVQWYDAEQKAKGLAQLTHMHVLAYSCDVRVDRCALNSHR